VSPEAGHPLALLNLEAIRERGFVVVPSEELEHLQAVADSVSGTVPEIEGHSAELEHLQAVAAVAGIVAGIVAGHQLATVFYWLPCSWPAWWPPWPRSPPGGAGRERRAHPI